MRAIYSSQSASCQEGEGYIRGVFTSFPPACLNFDWPVTVSFFVLSLAASSVDATSLPVAPILFTAFFILDGVPPRGLKGRDFFFPLP